MKDQVDASVMPDVAGGNIDAVVMMIAETAADMILGRPALLRSVSGQRARELA